MDDFIQPVKELSGTSNFTLIVGLIFIPNFSMDLFDGVFEVKQFPGQTMFYLDLHIGQFALAKIDYERVLYCNDFHQYGTVNIFAVLFEALDTQTWFALAIVLCFVYVYVVKTTHQGWLDSAFEIIQVLLQRVTRQQELCRLSILIGCFFFEFLYLSGTTESIIIPRKQQPPSSIHELLQTGHKWWLGPYLKSFGPEYRTLLKLKLETSMYPELHKEGFPGTLADMRSFWMEDVCQEDFKSKKELTRHIGKLWEQTNAFRLVRANSGLNLNSKTTCLVRYAGHTYIENTRRRCGLLQKLYVKTANYYYIFSLQSKTLKPKLDRILQDSGIHIHGKKIQQYYRQKQTTICGGKQIEKMRLADVRTIAIFGLLIAGLLIALATFCLEKKGVLSWPTAFHIICNKRSKVISFKGRKQIPNDRAWIVYLRKIRLALNSC